ncbi:type VI secretion system Vgr family protein [Azonexus sp. IMCC34842]|uniref:type VI secretion system Vgr family protein n=1 Tax=Azonexus sp. IMCC34842 TaxID=3420950 RepID=UPI003D14FC16
MQTCASRILLRPFLGHYLFQDKSLIEIVDELLGDWKSQGKLAPEWRWDLADVAAYPKRGMNVQYQETDLAFLKRLLAEEGLFCWFEHESGSGESLGQHRLVIADHNGAFKDNAQPRIRYTQAGATLSEDSLDRWHGLRQIDTAEINASSWDYRSLSPRPQSAGSAIANGAVPRTVAWHDPGQYAWQNSAHGERMQGNQRQGIDARLKQYQGEGTVRSGAPGTTFSLAEHPEHDLDPVEQRQFLITAITHRARNNLGESIPELIDSLGPVADDNEIPFAQLTDFYRNRLSAIRTGIAWRPEGRHISGRPTGNGTLTAIVVGSGQPTHTDRDGRVRVQFPWQRGGQSAARQEHPTGADNAPASDTLGVWLRVMAPVAGSNWGGHLTPRPGQEVVVAFQNGNIDRPVIVGSVYNGQGSADAQGNQIGSGTMQASANAPAFFAGQDAAPHTHGASLSGLKSQQLTSSQSGQGGYNQLVFDDTPGESRIELGTTEHLSHLQLGHLKQQSDNARQADRGHGGELATQAATAIRAGNGLLLSADARPGASSTQLDSREPISQTETAQSLSHSLADVAAKQNAALKGDPAADQLPAVNALKHAGEVMRATSTQGAQAASGSDIKTTQGGTGSIPAWSEPRIQYAAPGGIAQLTPKNHLLVAGKSLSIASSQDTNLIAQGNHSLATKDGLALFTVGKASGSKPNSETGIHLHAASGQISLQSQSGKTTAAADKKVTIASTTASLTASAKQKILATAQGAYLKIEGGDISVHAPGKVEFKGSQKNLTGPKASTVELPSLPKSELEITPNRSAYYSQQFDLSHLAENELTGFSSEGLPYRVFDTEGVFITQGRTNDAGMTDRIFTNDIKNLVVLIGDGNWGQEEKMEEFDYPDEGYTA